MAQTNVPLLFFAEVCIETLKGLQRNESEEPKGVRNARLTGGGSAAFLTGMALKYVSLTLFAEACRDKQSKEPEREKL